jgi:hypothetical protein
MAEAKRVIIRMPEDPLEYNTLTIIADELSAFMHEYDNGLIAGLTSASSNSKSLPLIYPANPSILLPSKLFLGNPSPLFGQSFA